MLRSDEEENVSLEQSSPKFVSHFNTMTIYVNMFSLKIHQLSDRLLKNLHGLVCVFLLDLHQTNNHTNSQMVKRHLMLSSKVT